MFIIVMKEFLFSCYFKLVLRKDIIITNKDDFFNNKHICYKRYILE